MKHSISIKTFLLLAIVGYFSFTSCVPQKKMLLLKNMEMANETTSIEYQNERSLEYKIKPGDNLFIRAFNMIDEKNVLSGDRSNYLTSDAAIYLSSYTVNKYSDPQL